MRYNVLYVKLNHHFIALGMCMIVSKSPNGEKGYKYVNIKRTCHVYCMVSVTYRSEICRKEKLLVKSRPSSSSSLNWPAAVVHVSSLKGLAKA